MQPSFLSTTHLTDMAAKDVLMTRDPTMFFERLLELEWPGRAVAVTPAPFDPVEAAPRDKPRSFEVLDVVIGPVPGDNSFASFRIIVAEHLRRHDWIGAASLMLVTARAEFTHWPNATSKKPPLDGSRELNEKPF